MLCGLVQLLLNHKIIMMKYFDQMKNLYSGVIRIEPNPG